MNYSYTTKIEERLAYLEGLVDALIFIGEHAEHDELPHARQFAMPLLYIISDQLRATERHLGAPLQNSRATN